MLKEGDIAPEFEAVATDGSTIRLSDYKGRNTVVLYFYPMDDTSGCTRQACDLRDAKPELDDLNAVVLGVSNDDLASHRSFTEKYSLNFPLLVDTDGRICDAYGVEHEGGPRRVTFLIDTDGVIARVWEKVSVVTHRADVSEAIAALGHS
jgi:peroxiredoxin Q/BCP